MDGTMWYGSLHLTCYVDETLHCNIYIYGWNYVYGWNLLMYEQCVWMKLMWYVIWNLCARYVLDMCWIWNLYMWYVLQIVGFNKKQKKQTICRLFAVCHRRQRVLCHQQRMAKRPRGRQLCFLGGWPIWSICHQQLMTKALPSVADGKGLPLTT